MCNSVNGSTSKANIRCYVDLPVIFCEMQFVRESQQGCNDTNSDIRVLGEQDFEMLSVLQRGNWIKGKR